MPNDDLHLVTQQRKDIRAGKGPAVRFKVLVDLLGKRTDLRGTYAPADYLEEAVRWSA